MSKENNYEEIKKLRGKLPKEWKWHKCYELAYFNPLTGRRFTKRHWALKSPEWPSMVCSLKLISNDNDTPSRKEFISDESALWVEKSLEITDALLESLAEKDKRIKELEASLKRLVGAVAKMQSLAEQEDESEEDFIAVDEAIDGAMEAASELLKPNQ